MRTINLTILCCICCVVVNTKARNVASHKEIQDANINPIDEEDLDLYNTTEDPANRLRTNFLKVLSAVLTRTKIPKDVQEATKTVMRETLNGQPAAEGYESYMVTSMLRVIDNTTLVQLKSMLTIMEESSPPESPMAVAVKALLKWLETEDGRRFIDFVVNYIRNLFQSLKRIVRPSSNNRVPNPSFLPGEVEFAIIEALKARELGHNHNRPGNNKPGRPPVNGDRRPPNGGGNNRVPIHQKPHQPENPHYPDRENPRYPDRDNEQHRPGHPQKPILGDRICFERVPE